MKIGFDAKRLFNNFTGLGNYSRTLVQNLQSQFPKNEYILFTPKTKHNQRTDRFFDQQQFRIVMPKNIGTMWRTKFITRHKEFKSLDVYHGLSHELPLGKAHGSVQKIVTIHDLIFKYYPSDYKLFDRLIYDAKFRYACRHADQIVAISNQTREDIKRYYQIDPEKIHVVYQSCDSIFREGITNEKKSEVKVTHHLPSEYMLYVGSVIGRKNLGGVIDAMSSTPKDLRIPLVIIGKGKIYEKEIKRKITASGLDHLCHWINPTFTDFPAIYSRAKLFVLPSFHEGFGIPLVEAMTVGTPVLTSNQSALKEIGSDACLTVPPDDSDAIREGIDKILSDSEFAKTLSTKGKERAQIFHPDALTHQMMEIYKR